MATPIVRAANTGDLSQLFALMEHTDPGMVIFPRNRREMAQRVEASQAAFASQASDTRGRDYFLVMEENAHIIGAAAIFTRLGSVRPFYNYRISLLSKVSPETGTRQDLHLLNLVNDCHGHAELGTLFLWPRARGKGRGRLLSLARLMLMAIDLPRFGQQICSEIRGWTNQDGRSPFWEALGRKFFQMDFDFADRLSTRDHRFIADLMPRHPVYVDLLGEAAQQVIGKCHPGAAPARMLLEHQGFRFGSLIDIFDGGPCLEAYTETLAIIRKTERRRARSWASAEPASGFVSTASIEGFAATMVPRDGDRSAALKRIGSTENDEILFYRYRPHGGRTR